MNSSPGAPPLEIFLLGLVDFQEVLSLQRRIVYEMGDGGGASLVALRAPANHQRGPSRKPGSCRTRRRWPARTGDPHSMGQPGRRVRASSPRSACGLSGRPAAKLGLTLSGYLEGLHQAIVGVLDEFELRGSVRADLPGVFLGQARVASVGVAVNRWIAYHGLTINVGPFLDLFDLLDEPGIGSASLRQTSMESRRQRCTPMPKVRESLIRHLERVLGFERHHVYTGHPLIRRKVLSHVYAPTPG